MDIIRGDIVMLSTQIYNEKAALIRLTDMIERHEERLQSLRHRILMEHIRRKVPYTCPAEKKALAPTINGFNFPLHGVDERFQTK